MGSLVSRWCPEAQEPRPFAAGSPARLLGGSSLRHWFLAHLHSLAVTMSQKPSVAQSPHTVPWALTADRRTSARGHLETLPFGRFMSGPAGTSDAGSTVAAAPVAKNGLAPRETLRRRARRSRAPPDAPKFPSLSGRPTKVPIDCTCARDSPSGTAPISGPRVGRTAVLMPGGAAVHGCSQVLSALPKRGSPFGRLRGGRGCRGTRSASTCGRGRWNRRSGFRSGRASWIPSPTSCRPG